MSVKLSRRSVSHVRTYTYVLLKLDYKSRLRLSYAFISILYSSSVAHLCIFNTSTNYKIVHKKIAIYKTIKMENFN